ncbi:hypothetical protein BBBOND_0203840 [Babesia bigemina]|uniref:C3H1-type domain-containing protein n=1 Tax=Babesia bigemina TaxID=5866 RepID=A0A061D3B1_BABBI|nr:hypothetical protein BBBOND_0203840 [Babesia bigemina]CDR95226.1 hypothetical protein BBBOND_0203840 [Babesia bigemina]|eukprot:XP_012767412.1 hypothetical protein BBBOND_0203840 [Babesia bigemina]
MRLDGLMLQRLPTDWQQKIHREFQTKLQLCISNPEEVRKTADFTWQTLLHGVEDRDRLAQRFGPHLGQYVGWRLCGLGVGLRRSGDSPLPDDGLHHGRSGRLPKERYEVDTPVLVGRRASGKRPTGDYGLSWTHRFYRIGRLGRQLLQRYQPAVLELPPRMDADRPEPRMVGGLSNVRRDVPPMGPAGSRHGHGSYGYGPRTDSFGPSSGSSRGGTVHAPSMVSRSGSFRSPTHMSSPEPRVHDPLDETLDNLIMKQRMDRLHGRAGAPLGVLTRSSKFSPAEGDSCSRGSPLSPPYDHPNGYVRSPSMRGAPPDDYHYSPGASPGKVQKICIKFPRCPFGDSCRYIHPAAPLCKNWPKCTFGPNCAFTHPPVPCKFNRNCNNPQCNYQHTG